MKRILATLLALTLVLALALPALAEEEQDMRPRIIITTDGEYDDQCSFLRLIMYSDVIDIDGLIYSAAECHWKGDGEHTQKEIVPHFKGSDMGQAAGDLTTYRYMNGNDWMRQMIVEDYGAVYANLRVHSPNYPTPGELASKIYYGNEEFEGDMRFDTEGSDHIKACILDDDPRVLIICSWGGFNTVARALKSIEEEYGETDQWEEIYDKVVNKVIIAGHGQDYTWDDYASISWPDLVCASGGGTWNYFMTQDYNEYLKADFWMDNIKFGHGPFMANFYLMGDGQHYEGEWEDQDVTPAGKVGVSDLLPYGYQHGEIRDFDTYRFYGHDRLQQYGIERYDFITEGDSGTYVWAVPLGPNAIDTAATSIEEALADLKYGTWGGRLEFNAETNTYGNLTGDYDPLLGVVSTSYNGGRYNDDMLNDLATRADWCVTPNYEDANHYPTVSVPERRITAAPGEKLSLTCEYSDPDGDELTVNWYQYQEAGTYARQFVLPDPSADTVNFAVPTDAADGDEIVMMVEVKDNGEHPLVDYAQVIITVEAPEEADAE